MNRLGDKIKTVAQVLLIITIGIYVVAAVLFSLDSLEKGLAVLIGGTVSSVIISSVLYGIGEIANNTADIKNALQGKNNKSDVNKALDVLLKNNVITKEEYDSKVEK